MEVDPLLVPVVGEVRRLIPVSGPSLVGEVPRLIPVGGGSAQIILIDLLVPVCSA